MTLLVYLKKNIYVLFADETSIFLNDTYISKIVEIKHLEQSKLYNWLHIHNISVHSHKPLQMIKALTARGWGNQTTY